LSTSDKNKKILLCNKLFFSGGSSIIKNIEKNTKIIKQHDEIEKKRKDSSFKTPESHKLGKYIICKI
jgi:hypothetical protein